MKYFIVTYMFGSSGIGTGIQGVVTEVYPNLKEMKEESKVKGFTVISIMEVTEDEYKEFWRNN